MGKGEIDERRQITLMDIAGVISSCLSPVLDVILAVVNSQHRVLNLVIFILIAIVILIIWICWGILFVQKNKNLEETCRSELRELKREKKRKKKAENDGENDDGDYHKKRVKVIKRYIKICRQRITIRKWMISLLSIGMISSIVMIGGQSFSIIRDKIEQKSNESSGTSVSGSGENTEVGKLDEPIDNEGATPEQIEKMKNKKFILKDLDRTVVLSKVDEEGAFYITSIDPEICGKEVLYHIEEIYNRKKSSTFSEGSIEKETAREAQSREDIFLNDIDKAEEYRTQEKYEDWIKVVPDSGELDGIIEKRERLWRPSEEDMEFNGDTCFRLANNYQLYADEYSAQGGKPETVIAYYVESIKWTERGLAYKDIVKDRETYYKYLKTRYKDIYDYIKKNSGKFGEEEEKYQEIGKKAGAIYEAM